ncbi:RNA polymerase recycling motor HelD [Paenibacillus macquariensis]|uniref:DNA helicase-2 / ATP-dependent DNA helicase PcrA n=1 Tax=Paenibacillus macquariensis TaxID=948756 RepID=A0ABY1KBE1_9BACL|nr:RNA polymerase recycling motor HelD [Paenibacillus macquariensis]MEC0094241.1 RNA polymerase recycling motor HelD [Paenibacillus macquariensis]OAB32135.1 helicase [Paenibacillus macquariensis subsp. macquariensis]SIR55037.1 DNA helicase-2 / ATP-dependent DNA helicase PcrA [Paenibacillus macquariensis]
MGTSDQEWRDEQHRVDEVTTKVTRRIEKLQREVGNVRGDVVDLRKEFWDEVRVNFSSSDDLGETSTSLRQQSQVLSERERSHLQSSESLKKMKLLVRSPYFGRIDFEENGSNHKETIYLGIASFLDDDDATFLVYDWRAPVSSLYYDGAPGPASYDTPMGEINGEMNLKRQFVIRNAQIQVLFDTGVTIGDELLQQVLSHSADNQMKSIVATIQKEQNAVIRNDKSRMLVVQGSAGSGKTSAALQRVAYLLYKYREILKADQVLLFSPNPLFNSYVSSVLPELGEENMQQTTFQAYLDFRLAKEFELEDIFSQMETMLNTDEGHSLEVKKASINYKSSPAYLEVVTRYKEYLESRGMMFRAIQFQGRLIISSDTMKEKFYSFEPSVKLDNRIEMMRDWMLKELSVFAKNEREAAWVDNQIDLLSADEYQKAYTRVRRKQHKKKDTFDDYEKERDLLARMIVNEWLKPVRRWIKRKRFVDAKGLYRELFLSKGLLQSVSGQSTLPAYWNEISEITVADLKSGKLSYEDATPYLYLQELVKGFQTNNAIRYVFIDEVQDYSPFQLEYLKRLFPRARMTALGDLNQGIYTHASVLDSMESLQQLYGPQETEVISLIRSYRSTYEIVDFTRSMMPGGENIVPFNRQGDKPIVVIETNRDHLHQKIIEDIKVLNDQGYEHTAIICKTLEESKQVYDALKEHLTLKKVTKTTPSFVKGTLVIPSYLAKGVEFDAVIIYNASNESYTRESERKLFYTVCTRAMHLLHIYSLGEPSHFITEVSSEKYELLT